MSTRRAYTLLRAYVGREWDRISSIDRDMALNELNEALGKAKVSVETPKNEQTTQKSEPIMVPADPEAQKSYARQLLGVTADASYEEIRASFTRLNKRADPSNFPENSAEAAHAAIIQKKVHWAHAILSEGMDDTERRFRSLEI